MAAVAGTIAVSWSLQSFSLPLTSLRSPLRLSKSSPEIDESWRLLILLNALFILR